MECVAIVHQVRVPARVTYQLGKNTSQVPTGLEYHRNVRLGIDQGVGMVSLQCLHGRFTSIAGMDGIGHCLAVRDYKNLHVSG